MFFTVNPLPVYQQVSAIAVEVFGAGWGDPVKLDGKRKILYLFLRGFFLAAIAKA